MLASTTFLFLTLPYMTSAQPPCPRCPAGAACGPEELLPMPNRLESAATCCDDLVRDEVATRVHSLADLGDDPQLAAWLAKSIEGTIEPGTWKDRCSVRWFAPRKILIVTHTSEVQARVEKLLADVKQTVKSSTPTNGGGRIAQAQHTEPAPLLTTDKKSPRHAFEFRIDGVETSDADGGQMKIKNVSMRYEGEGVIDFGDILKKASEMLGGDAASLLQMNGPPLSGDSGGWIPDPAPRANVEIIGPVAALEDGTVRFGPRTSATMGAPSRSIPPIQASREELLTMPKRVGDR